MLWEVLIRSYSWGLSPRGLRRPVSGYRGVILLWGKWHVSRSWFMLSECFLDLEEGIRGSSESSISWSEAELGSTGCLWLCFLWEYETSSGWPSEGATYWSEESWVDTRRGGSAGPYSTSIASLGMLVPGLGGGKSRGAAVLLDEPGFEARSEDSTSTFCFAANSSRIDWKASNMDAWKVPICCCKCIFKESPSDFSMFFWILFCKAVPGVGLGWCFQGQGTEGKRLWTGGWGKKAISSTLEVCIGSSEGIPSPSPKRSSSSLELVVAFCFFRYRFLFEIFCNCPSVKDVQISQGVSKVTQGSSPLPASLQVGQKLCVSKLKQKWRHFWALGLSLFAWWRDIVYAIKDVQ